MNGLNIRLVPKLSLGMHTSGWVGFMVCILNGTLGTSKTCKEFLQVQNERSERMKLRFLQSRGKPWQK